MRGRWISGCCSGSFAVCGFSTNGLVATHLIPYCIDHGIARGDGRAACWRRSGVFDLIGTTARAGSPTATIARILLFWYYGLRGLSLMVLPFSNFDLVSLAIFAVFYGLDWVATVPPTVPLTNEVFGKRDAPVIVSWIVCGHQIGGAIAAVGAGVMRNTTGSYFGAFIASGVACLIASLIVLRYRTSAGAGDRGVSATLTAAPAGDAPPPVAAAARPARAYRSASWRYPHVPAAIAGCAGRRHAPAGARRKNAAARAATPAPGRGQLPAPPA